MKNAPPLSIASIQAIVDRCPFNRWLGIRILSVEAGALTLSIKWREEFMSAPERRSTHGGILASLVDAAGVYAIATHIGGAVPTIDMRIDYHRMAGPDNLRAEARVINLGSKLSTAETRIFDVEDRLVASGRALYFTGVPPMRPISEHDK